MLKDLWKNYSIYLRFANKESKIAIFSGILGAILETFSIYLLADIISSLGNQDALLSYDYVNSLPSYINQALFFVSAISSASLYFLSNKNIVKSKSIIERHVREEITSLTLNIKWEYYLKLSQGDISKSIISEGQNISEGFMYFISAITYGCICTIYFLTCMLFVPQTSFILIVYALFAYRIYIYYSKRADKFGKNLSEITSNIGKWTSSIFDNLKYLRAISKDTLAREESSRIFKKFADSYENARVASYKSKFITEILTIIFIFITILFVLITNSSSSTLILSLSLFIRMTPKIYNTQTRLLDSLAMVSWPRMHHKKMAWAKNFEYKYQENKDSKSIFKGNILFNNISFNYPSGPVILEDLDLLIKRNKSIGIVGKSGSGKSTIVNLITGLINSHKGEITISGKNLQEININHWRKNIGIVMQENFFKNDTIAENVSLSSGKVDYIKLEEALKKANAWEFVQKLSNGINEIMFDRGFRFSGGERQKLALARALYSDPNLLILDEPSNGLDYYSESQFIATIRNLLGSMTIVIISHKRNVVSICDDVFILENRKLKKI